MFRLDPQSSSGRGAIWGSSRTSLASSLCSCTTTASLTPRSCSAMSTGSRVASATRAVCRMRETCSSTRKSVPSSARAGSRQRGDVNTLGLAAQRHSRHDRPEPRPRALDGEHEFPAGGLRCCLESDRRDRSGRAGREAAAVGRARGPVGAGFDCSESGSARCKAFCGPRRGCRGVWVTRFRGFGGRGAGRGRGPRAGS